MNSQDDKMRIELMEITPAMAQRWLDEANKWNRRPRKSFITKLASDIVRGRWVLTHQGIAFDKHGILIDGQNRLYAIVQADRAVPCYVTFNAPRESMIVVDCGGVRTLTDSCLFYESLETTTHHASTAKSMLDPNLASKTTRQEELAFLMKHYTAIDWACGLVIKKVRKITSSQLRAVLARAYYSEDRERVATFAEVMVSGIPTGKNDTAAIRVRDKLMGLSGTGNQDRRAAYKMIEWGLRKFLENDGNMRAVGYASEEQFPLPEERTPAKRNGKEALHHPDKPLAMAV